LDGLEFGDRLAERLALLRVRRRVLEAGARDADSLRRDPDAPGVERLHRNLEAGADGAEAIRVRDASVLEDQLRRVRSADAELVLLLGDDHPRLLRVHEEAGDAVMPRARIRLREEQHDAGMRAGGDEVLGAVDVPV